MRLLVDEQIGASIVVWLRAQGHDVLYAAEANAGWADDELLSLASAENRIIVTEDKDFGELVFRRRQATHGVVLLRMKDASVAERLRRLEQVWEVGERTMPGKMIVVDANKVRVRQVHAGP